MRNFGRNIGIYLIVFIAVLSLSMFVRNMGSANEYKEIKFSQFANHLESGDYEKVNITDRQITGTKSNGDQEVAYSPSALEINWLENNILFPMIDEGKVELESDPPKSEYTFFNLLPTILMVLAMVFLFYFMMSQGGNKQAFQFGKNRARLYKSDSKSITFKDVAGLEEEKEELAEIVDFLKNPSKYDKLGARIPKGVLLVGHPGTGKTYISKATAGEAGVPFFTISGSDFVEMFVGVGASRVRDLFNEAKKNAPCIVFIDEIDAVGRRRGAGLGGGNDEREQTLNQLLVEMDGFDGNIGIIVLAATNRPDVLDPALLRPGRFDRQIVIGMPDIKGREELFRLYTKNKPLADDVSPEILAKRTPGFSPADIENLINEAALLTARRNGTKIRMAEIEEATTKVMAGPQKKSRVISDDEKKLTAYHEAGHAIVMRALPDSDPVHQITIIPRGMAGGFTMWLPEEDRFFETRGHMYNTIKHLLGGRVAEELKLDDISTGASNDLERATGIAREMVTKYGFSKKLGPVSFSSNDEVFLGRDFSTRQNISEEVAAEVDREIRSILEDCYADTRRILRENNAAFERVARALLMVETLDGDQFERLFSGSATPEMIREEFEYEMRKTQQQNREEAAESARIDEERKRDFERQMERMSDMEDRDYRRDPRYHSEPESYEPQRSDDDGMPEFVRGTDRHRKPAKTPKPEKPAKVEEPIKPARPEKPVKPEKPAKPERKKRRRFGHEDPEESFREDPPAKPAVQEEKPEEPEWREEAYSSSESDSHSEPERYSDPGRSAEPEHYEEPAKTEEPEKTPEPAFEEPQEERRDQIYGREILMTPRSAGPIKPLPINPVTEIKEEKKDEKISKSEPSVQHTNESVPASPAPEVSEPEPETVPDHTSDVEPDDAAYLEKDRIVDMEDYQRATEILQQNILRHSRKSTDTDGSDDTNDSSDN